MHPPTNKQVSHKVSVDMNTLLGKGSTGNVYQGFCLDQQCHAVAVKVIPLQEINNQVTSYLLQCELQALKATSKQSNESIVKLQEIVVVDNHCYIAMELLQGGTLKDFIAQSKKLQPSQALFILQRILEGYQILKSNGIIHRDLKPDNIIFASSPQEGVLSPKIIDFGYCIMDRVQKKPKMYYNVGSPRYMSPEAYTGNKYSQKSDIWSLGIVFYEMLTGTNFDKGKDIVETFKLIKQKGIPIPSSLNPQCRKILQNMLMLDPSKRWGCDDLLRIIYHPEEQELQQRGTKSNVMKQFQLIQNKNMRQLRSTIMADKFLSPVKSPNTRAVWLSSSPMKASQILTRSVGQNFSPQGQNNISGFSANQITPLRLEKARMFNRSTNQEYKQGPSTDRNQRPVIYRGNGLQASRANKTLPMSSSQQNLHQPQGYYLQKTNHQVNRQEIKRRVNIRQALLIPKIKDQYEDRVYFNHETNANRVNIPLYQQPHKVNNALPNYHQGNNVTLPQAPHAHNHNVHFVQPKQMSQPNARNSLQLQQPVTFTVQMPVPIQNANPNLIHSVQAHHQNNQQTNSNLHQVHSPLQHHLQYQNHNETPQFNQMQHTQPAQTPIITINHNQHPHPHLQNHPHPQAQPHIHSQIQIGSHPQMNSQPQLNHHTPQMNIVQQPQIHFSSSIQNQNNIPNQVNLVNQVNQAQNHPNQMNQAQKILGRKIRILPVTPHGQPLVTFKAKLPPPHDVIMPVPDIIIRSRPVEQLNA